MTRKLPILIVIFFALGFFSACTKDDSSICNQRVIFEGDQGVSLGDNEKLLLCGDANQAEWDNVPLAQTEAILHETLKAYGHYDASFRLDGQTLVVDPGLVFNVTNVVYHHVPKDFHDEKYIGWKNQHLTAQTLDGIQDWTMRRLKSLGYACAKVEIKAVIETGQVEVMVVTGSKYTFPKIQYPTDNQMTIYPKVLQRFYAFDTGEVYDANLLELTSQRTKNEGIVAYTGFETICEEGKISVSQKVSPGTAHIFKVAAGVSTEEFPIVRLSWKNSRVGMNGSNIFAKLYGSNLRQEFSLGFEWHTFEDNRWFFKPYIVGNRIREQTQKYIEAGIYTPIGVTKDIKGVELYVDSGPAYVFQDVSKGDAVGKQDFGLWVNTLQLTSHGYEFYGSDPREGYQLRMDTTSIVYKTSNQIQAHAISIQGTKLWNVFALAPPKYVIGVRFGLNFVLGWNSQIRQRIPQDYFSWLGGDQSLRGFNRRELPDETNNDGVYGALSTFYTGVELRYNDSWGKGLDPFVFFDAGMLGKENLAFDSTVYTSPGVGLRYESPFGVLRGTVAHGIVIGSSNPGREHIQFFLSLGSEF